VEWRGSGPAARDVGGRVHFDRHRNVAALAKGSPWNPGRKLGKWARQCGSAVGSLLVPFFGCGTVTFCRSSGSRSGSITLACFRMKLKVEMFVGGSRFRWLREPIISPVSPLHMGARKPFYPVQKSVGMPTSQGVISLSQPFGA